MQTNFKKSVIKNLSVLALLFITANGVWAQSKVKPSVNDVLYPSKSAVLEGLIGEKLDLAYKNRVEAQDIQQLIAPFNNKTETYCWQGEFWGKWFTSAVAAYRYKPEQALKAKIDSAVALLLKTQLDDGYIGNYAPEYHLKEWDIWGRKYSMLGLLAYYELTKDKKTLQAAAKVADHLIGELAAKGLSIAEQGNYKGMAASSVLEPIVLLYKNTGNVKYLHFAEEIVKAWETPTGAQLISKANVPVSQRFPYPTLEHWVLQGQKAYEMMSCYEGLLELYRITGNATYKNAVEQTWQSILDTEINILGSGSASECWYGGKKHQQHVTLHNNETCVTVTWIKLSQQLLRLTGESKYADAIEKSYYNALLGAMKPDGSDWSMYSQMAGIRSFGTNQCNMGLNCCVASGPRGLFTLPSTIVTAQKEGVQVNFYNEGTFTVETPKKQSIQVKQQTAYPVDGKIKLQLAIKKAEQFAVNLRIPAWSKNSQVEVNGKPIEQQVIAGQYLNIKRQWQNGDELTLNLDMRGRIETLSGEPDNLALLRGPMVLVRDFRLSGPISVDEIITPVQAQDGFVPMKMISSANGAIKMAFEVPCIVGSWRIGENAKPVNLTFIDYLSSGSTFSDASRYRVWFPQLLDPSVTGAFK